MNTMTCQLRLNPEGSRRIVVTSPTAVTRSEMKRILGWIGVQLLIEERPQPTSYLEHFRFSECPLRLHEQPRRKWRLADMCKGEV